MSRIATIEGIKKAGEMSSRAANVPGMDYIPFATMTEGQLEVEILRQDAVTKAALYPEIKVYAQARDMLANALRGQIPSTGTYYDPVLQYVGNAITSAARKGAPASAFGAVIPARIGADIIDLQLGDCKWWAMYRMNEKYNLKYTDPSQLSQLAANPGHKALWYLERNECEILKAIEPMLNRAIPNMSHHVLYKSLEGAAYPPDVNTKKILHRTGVGAIGNSAGLKVANMDAYIEMAIKRKNAAVGVGDEGSVASSLILKDAADEKIGVITVAAVTALIIAIAGAVTAAAAFAKEVNAKKANVMSTAQGFGTPGYGPDKKDWSEKGGGNGGGSTSGGGLSESEKTGLMIGGAALGLYLITRK